MSRSATQPFAQLGALIAGTLGLATLAGYLLHIESAISIKAGLQGMSPLTAISLVSISVSFIAEVRGHERVAVLAAGLSALMGAGILTAHAVWGADIVSPFVAERVFHFDPEKAGRTATATASCLTALSLAELTRHRPLVSDTLTAGVLIVSGLALLCYAYGVVDFYSLRIFSTMALHTATALFILAVVSVSVRPDEGWSSIAFSREPAGSVTRRQLAFILVPPIIGWMLMRAVSTHSIGPAVALATLVVATVIPLAILVLRDGRILLALDAERRTKSAMQAALHQELEDRLAAQAMHLKQESLERSKAEEALHRAQRMDAIGQLTGGIAHDFNNLLMAIRGNLELAARQVARGLPAGRFIDSAAEAAQRGSKLTSQLLTFSRTQKLDLGPVEIDPTLHRARDLIGNAMGPTIEVSLQLSARDQWAWTDATQLELAILNLALNARDAMPDGGRLTIESRTMKTRIGEDGTEADFIEVKATDTGRGMSSDVAARAVEPFFTTKDRGKGTGLGLAQVYGFVRQCGGDLHIQRNIGKGTCISLLFPCVPALETRDFRADEPRSFVQEPRSRHRDAILVIDDDDTVRAILTEALRSNGYEVHEAGDGFAGLKILQNLSPALVIIDFLMPGLNGADVARRAQSLQPGLPVLFVSGYSDTMALEGIPGAGFLRKPFEIDRLERAVSSLLH